MSLDITLVHTFKLTFALTFHCITSCAWRHILASIKFAPQTMKLLVGMTRFSMLQCGEVGYRVHMVHVCMQGGESRMSVQLSG